MERVESVDVQRWVRLSKAEFLGIGENFVKRKSFLLHRGKDVVAGSVQDAVDRFDPVSGEAVPQGANDRDAAADRGTEEDVDAFRGRQPENFGSVFGEHLLVRGNDGLARF